jgi:hypothetical protein
MYSRKNNSAEDMRAKSCSRNDEPARFLTVCEVKRFVMEMM